MKLFIDGLEIPVEDRVGEGRRGFSLHSRRPEPELCLVAAEALA